MIAAPATDSVPFATDEHGVVRSGGTRVTLDTVVAAFANGASAEKIVHQYDVLGLADVHAVIAYDLRHTSEVDAHLADQLRLREDVKQQNEARFDPSRAGSILNRANQRVGREEISGLFCWRHEPFRRRHRRPRANAVSWRTTGHGL